MNNLSEEQVEQLQREAALWRTHGPVIHQMLAAIDVLSPLVLTRLKLQDAANNYKDRPVESPPIIIM